LEVRKKEYTMAHRATQFINGLHNFYRVMQC